MKCSVPQFATERPTVCAVCRRQAMWVGYAARPEAPIIWLCDENACHAAAARVYAMPKPMLESYELKATLEAGDVAGAYLDEIGKSDMATLDPGEWREFLRLLLTNYEDRLRRHVLEGGWPL